jgi:iron complex outermembrane receptor protein
MSAFRFRRHAALLFLTPLPLLAGALADRGIEVAAHQPVQLDAVHVEGKAPSTPTAPTLDEARARAGLVAGGTAVIDADDYKSGRASTLQDALGYAPGVFIQPRFGAEESRISIRGSGIQRTFHGRGITLLQDGASVNLADGGFDFQAIEPLATQYIEVYRGANALEYGSTTLGGAINYVSPTGYTAPALSARLEAGSFEYRRAQGSVAGHNGNVDGYLSVSALHADGYRDHARQDNYRLFANLGIQLAPSVETRLYFSFVDTESELPGSLTRAETESTPSRANAGNVGGDQKRDFRLIRIADRTVWTIGDGQTLEGSAFYADKRLFHPIFQVINQDNSDLGLTLRYTLDGQLFGHRNRVIVGSRYVYGETKEFRAVNVAGQNGAQTDGSDQTARSIALYAENQFFVLPELAVSIGAQGARDRRVRFDNFVPTGEADGDFKNSYGGFSPKLGVLWNARPGTQLFANLSRSYEPPSLSELTGGSASDPRINGTQRGTTIEIGSRIEHALFALDIALYRAWIKDELLALNDPDGQPLGTINAPKAIHQGLELAGVVRLPLGLSWRSAYLLNDFRFDDNAVYGDNRLAGLPTQSLRSDLVWKGHGLSIGPSVEWIPNGSWIDHANTFSSDGYTLLGFRVSGALAGHWNWFIDGRNLTGEKYAATTGVIANANGADARQFLPGDGRAVYLGIGWSTGQ